MLSREGRAWQDWGAVEVQVGVQTDAKKTQRRIFSEKNGKKGHRQARGRGTDLQEDWGGNGGKGGGIKRKENKHGDKLKER